MNMAIQWQPSETRTTSVLASDTHYKTLAMSILTGYEMQDGDRYGPILPVEMAKDVCRWAGYEVI